MQLLFYNLVKPHMIRLSNYKDMIDCVKLTNQAVLVTTESQVPPQTDNKQN